MNIIVSGMIAAVPHQGGATWAVLQYLLGLRALGHRVLFVEPIEAERVQPLGSALCDSTNAAYFRNVLSQFGLFDDAALLLAGSHTTVGIDYSTLEKRAGKTDVLINISGMLADDNLLTPIPIRAFLDLDPAFIQLWHSQGIDMRFANHTHFVTIGISIGESDCSVPTCDVTWLHTLQPIVLEHWPVAHEIVYDGLTTIGNWRGYGPVEYNGRHYGQKAHSMRQFIELPLRTSEAFFPALAIHPDEIRDLEALKRCGWHLLDPSVVSGTPHDYRQFIQQSKAEFGIAKSGYMVSQCGWFSDRSICYLASGRPVIAQETGFSRFLPTGEGLFAFETADEVIVAIESINADYSKHRHAARHLAEEFFDSRKVLSQLLSQLELSS